MLLVFDANADDKRQKDNKLNSYGHAVRGALEEYPEGISTFTNATRQSLMSSIKNKKVLYQYKYNKYATKKE